MLTSAKPDLDAYNTATTMSTAELVTALRGRLGAKLVAYLGKVTKPARCGSGPRAPEESPMPSTSTGCGSYRGAAMITARDSNQVAQAWFQGLNPATRRSEPRGCCAAATSRRSDRRCSPPRGGSPRRVMRGDAPAPTRLLGSAHRLPPPRSGAPGYRPNPCNWTPWEYRELATGRAGQHATGRGEHVTVGTERHRVHPVGDCASTRAADPRGDKTGP